MISTIYIQAAERLDEALNSGGDRRMGDKKARTPGWVEEEKELMEMMNEAPAMSLEQIRAMLVESNLPTSICYEKDDSFGEMGL